MRQKLLLTIFVLPYLFSPAFCEDQPVKIAAIFAKTGIAVSENASYIPMIELAVEELNSQGGLLGRPVELIVLDNQSTPIGSTMAAQKAVQQKVTVVIGASWSSHSLAMAPILQKAGIPMISPSSTNPRVTLVGDCIFRVCFIDSKAGRVMARFAYSDLGARTAAVLKIINEEYSLTLAEFFSKSFYQHGGKVVFDGSYTSKAVDFKELLKKVKSVRPDVVFVPGYSRDAGLLIRQAAAMGIQTKFLGGDGLNQISEFGGDAVEGSYYFSHWHPDIRSEPSMHLQKVYWEKFQKKLTATTAPLAYDAVMVLADAIRRANSLDRSEIRKALSRTMAYKGATGSITFDANGDPRDKDVIIMVLGKKDHLYFKTMEP